MVLVVHDGVSDTSVVPSGRYATGERLRRLLPCSRLPAPVRDARAMSLACATTGAVPRFTVDASVIRNVHAGRAARGRARHDGAGDPLQAADRPDVTQR